MNHARVRRAPRRRLTVALAAALPLLAVAVLVAGCGGLNKTTSSSSSSRTSRSVQVLYTVKSGDLIETAAGRATLTDTTKGKVTATVQVVGSAAAQVAAGQSVTVSFIKLPAGFRAGGGQSGGSAGYNGVRPSGAPSPGSGGYFGGSGGQGYFGGSGSGGQGYFGGSGQGARLRNAKQTTATVTAVQAGSNDSVTATIAIAKLPSGVTAKYTGIAQIAVKVLAQNVLIVPTAAVKGSGSSATVQLLKGGQTVTQSVTVGQETQTEAEITSGLSAGDSIVYTRTFSGFPGFRGGSGGYGGYGGFSGGQGGYPAGQSNGQSGGTTGGV
jgi:hypothetical protein